MPKRIMGNILGLPNPQTDWNQTDKTKGDYLKSREELLKLISKNSGGITDLGTFEFRTNSNFNEIPEDNEKYRNTIDNLLGSGIYKCTLWDDGYGFGTNEIFIVTQSDMDRMVQVKFTTHEFTRDGDNQITYPKYRVNTMNPNTCELEWTDWENGFDNKIDKKDGYGITSIRKNEDGEDFVIHTTAESLQENEYRDISVYSARYIDYLLSSLPNNPSSNTDMNKVMWANIQQSGLRNDYNYAFGYDVQKDIWNDKTFFPVFDLKPTNANRMFKLANMTNIKQRLIDCGVTLDFSNCTNLAFAFQAVKSKEIPEINASKVSNTLLIGLFQNSTSLESVDKLILPTSGTTEFTNSFSSCSKLKRIIIEGVIGRTVSFSSCPLDLDSRIQTIFPLKNSAGTDDEGKYRLTFKESCWEYLEENARINDAVKDTFAPTLDDFEGTWKELVMALGWLVS